MSLGCNKRISVIISVIMSVIISVILSVIISVIMSVISVIMSIDCNKRTPSEEERIRMSLESAAFRQALTTLTLALIRMSLESAAFHQALTTRHGLHVSQYRPDASPTLHLPAAPTQP